MHKLPYFTFKEHGEQDAEEIESLLEVLGNKIKDYELSSDNLKYLGLNEKCEADYFIGMRWISWAEGDQKRKGVIWVRPKHHDIPFEKLFWKCLSHPIVNKHMGDCYRIFPEEDAIPLPGSAIDFVTPLLIADFLVRVRKLSQKGLRKRFVNIQETLNSRVKGKLLVTQTLREQVKKSTLIQTRCSYQIQSTNCIENQILKAALLQTQKYLNRHKSGESSNALDNLLHANLRMFSEVTVRSLSQTDFEQINHSAFYQEYKPALNLAKLILKSLGLSINSDISKKDRTVPPFYINMPELFERYCEVLLRNRYPDTLSGYGYTGYSETRLGKSKLRPDFIIPSENRIVDSKYKYWIDRSDDIEGLRQLSLYSRHVKALEKLNNRGIRPKLQFLYPENDGAADVHFDSDRNMQLEDYPEIYKYAVSIL